MKDYLIRFDADGHRQETYADGVHYTVESDGTIVDGSVVVSDLLAQGYVWVDVVDYGQYLNGKVRGADGKPTEYIPPERRSRRKKLQKSAKLRPSIMHRLIHW